MPDPQYLYDSQALRALETRAAEASGDPFDLMRRAGRAAWRELLARWPVAQRIVVVCGPGNNGGDGYVLARQAAASGRAVRVVRLAGHAPRAPNARQAEREYHDQQGQVDEFDGQLPAADVIVDALFGIGFCRVPEGEVAALIEVMNAAAVPVLSLDVPSGIDADRGSAPGAAVHASRTLQFLGAHAGLATGVALDHVGQRALAVLEGASATPTPDEAVALELGPADLAGAFRPRRRDTHKGDSGHVLCIGGERGSAGALVLCGEAALRTGAGLASLATRAAHVGAVLARCPELMPRAVDGAPDLAGMLARADVLALGPGLGLSPWARELFEAALAAGKPTVIDADALGLLAAAPAALPPHAILTPHPGEAGRLLGVDVASVQADRFGAAAALSTRHDCVVVLKGAGTIVAAPGRRPRVIGAGNPGMAVGGMGDVLTGVIASLRAQGWAAFAAACDGALLHALAGDAAAADGGERGLLPTDLYPHLRRLANSPAPADLATS